MSFIPYQIDYSVQNTAKTIGFSKKRIVFKFGFANRHAIYNEQRTGAECRGSEHEIVFVWSLKSGKRQLFCNGKEIHYSISHMNGWTNDTSWQHIFTLSDNSNTSSSSSNHPPQRYRLQFITQQPNKTNISIESNHPTTTTTSNHPFDLKINNLSYFSFNPIYQLGTPRMIVGPINVVSNHHPNHRFRSDSPMTPEERQQLALAKLASLQDIAQQRNTTTTTNTTGMTEPTNKETVSLPQQLQQQQDDLLISFDDEDKKDLVASGAAALEHSMTIAMGPPTNIVTSPYHSNSNNNNHMNASSITFDQHFPLNSSSTTILDEYSRQQPGSFFNSSSINHTNTNPYASTQPSYTTSTNNNINNNSTNTNPYTTNMNNSTTNPYDPSTNSTALTPYQPPTTTNATTIGTTGIAPPVPNPYSQYYPPSAGGNYYNNNTTSTSANSTYVPPPPSSSSSNHYTPPPVIQTSQYYPPTNTNTTTTTAPYDLQSPSATTVFTYGSAPSFAQPPKPPPPTTTSTMSYPQQPPPSYSSNINNDTYSNTNPYGITTPMSYSTSPYGGPISNTNNMYQPPPPQQQPYAPTPSSYHY